MATASEFVAVAQSQVGVKEQPPTSNRTKYGEWYGMNGQPWCDMFVSWCAAQVGALGKVGKSCYCPSHVNYFKSKGWWLDRGAQPRPGDVIFFANKGLACHVGIVESVKGNTIHTIEGNTSVTSNDNGGAVMRRERTLGTLGSTFYILGYGRVPWDAEEVKREDLPMTFILHPDECGTLYLVDGVFYKRIPNPKSLDALGEAYKQAEGKDLKTIVVGTKSDKKGKALMDTLVDAGTIK